VVWVISGGMDRFAEVRQRFTVLEAVLDEKSCRLLVSAESRACGAGGISAISKTTGVSRQVIRQGLRELEQSPTHPAGRIQCPGFFGGPRVPRWTLFGPYDPGRTGPPGNGPDGK
jgi:hypothetical protein